MKGVIYLNTFPESGEVFCKLHIDFMMTCNLLKTSNIKEHPSKCQKYKFVPEHLFVQFCTLVNCEYSFNMIFFINSYSSIGILTNKIMS